MLEVVPSAEPETWLRKQLPIIEDKPTVAGLVVFADEPQVVLPKAAVKIYRYKTSDPQGTRETLDHAPETIEGSLYEQIYGAVRRTQEIVQDVRAVLGTSGLEEIAYPAETLHEIITNSVLHRDYAVQDDVHVRVFDNRIEVESPGRLPLRHDLEILTSCDRCPALGHADAEDHVIGGSLLDAVCPHEAEPQETSLSVV